MSLWTTAGPAVAAAFVASTVEVVEAFTILLAVSTIRGWRPPLIGGGAALLVLAVVVAALGPLLSLVPLHALQLAIGVLLLLFGLGWLRKAVLRAAGVIPLHDEVAIFERERLGLGDAAGGLAALAAFKAVLLEGLEVVFIVLAVGAGGGALTLWSAAIGALGACLAVVAVGLAVRRPLSRVPENSLKFAVGVMLSAFGVFWTGEGLGVSWPGDDLALPAFAALFLVAGLALTPMARRRAA
ncbi:MAG TPA: hypothetical protein VIC25_02045 [Caulobacteraceae bacterium]|jgi:uncharacterized membrane protein